MEGDESRSSSGDNQSLCCCLCGSDPYSMSSMDSSGGLSFLHELSPAKESFRPSVTLERALELLLHSTQLDDLLFLTFDKTALFNVLTSPKGAPCCSTCLLLLHKSLETAAQIIEMETSLKNYAKNLLNSSTTKLSAPTPRLPSRFIHSYSSLLSDNEEMSLSALATKSPLSSPAPRYSSSLSSGDDNNNLKETFVSCFLQKNTRNDIFSRFLPRFDITDNVDKMTPNPIGNISDNNPLVIYDLSDNYNGENDDEDMEMIPTNFLKITMTSPDDEAPIIEEEEATLLKEDSSAAYPQMSEECQVREQLTEASSYATCPLCEDFKIKVDVCNNYTSSSLSDCNSSLKIKLLLHFRDHHMPPHQDESKCKKTFTEVADTAVLYTCRESGCSMNFPNYLLLVQHHMTKHVGVLL